MTADSCLVLLLSFVFLLPVIHIIEIIVIKCNLMDSSSGVVFDALSKLDPKTQTIDDSVSSDL